MKRMNGKRIAWTGERRRTPGPKRRMILPVLAAMAAFAGLLQAEEPQPLLINAEILIEDVCKLAHILETTHPDPYAHGGGKIAFHRRFQQAMNAIPEDGMTLEAFHRHILPLVAAVGDGHTSLRLPPGRKEGPGLPFRFAIVEDLIYVEGVFDERHRPLLGAKLCSLAGVPFEALLDRQKKLIGWDNEFQLLSHLAQSLATRSGFELLLPEWTMPPGAQAGRIETGFILPSGEAVILEAPVPGKAPEGHLLQAPSKVTLPTVEKIDFNYGFLDPERRIALLRIDGMSSFREHFEFMRARGAPWIMQHANQVYRRYHGRAAPENPEEVLAGIPAAADVFRDLVSEMKQAGTEKLILDLRRNGGGNSLMGNLLVYFLHGWGPASKFSAEATIKKYSDLYFSMYGGESLEKINQGRRIPLGRDDYDFQEDPSFGAVERSPAEYCEPCATQQMRSDRLARRVRMPVFPGTASGNPIKSRQAGDLTDIK